MPVRDLGGGQRNDHDSGGVQRAVSVGVQMTCGCVTEASGTDPSGTGVHRLTGRQARYPRSVPATKAVPASSVAGRGQVGHVGAGTCTGTGFSGGPGGGSSGPARPAVVRR